MTAPQIATPAAVTAAAVWLRRAYLTLCLLLLAQFVLGMVVNLFVQVTAHHPGAQAADYFSGSGASIGWAIADGPGWLAAHVALGLALILAGIIGLVFALRTGGAGPITTAVIGLLTILGAAFNGASFLDYNHDFSSMIMAGLFAAALASYTIGLYQRHVR